jgi:putative ABC transport system permease protein
MMGSPRAGASRLTIDDVAAVARETPAVEDWDPQAELRQAVRAGELSTTARVTGQSERWERVWGRGVSRGASFDATAVTTSARVALIGETVARDLFPSQDPVGAEIRIGSVPFTVIGVLERFGTDMHGMDRDNEIVVPITTLMRRLTNADAINAAKLLVREGASQKEASREVKRVLRERHALDRDQPDDFRLMTSVEVARMMQTIERILFLYVPLAGGIVLLVGGVVAAALMLASVNERTGEIGLRRAVGAQPIDIRAQFLIETAAIIIAGAVLGILLGYIGAQLLATRMQLGNAFSWAAVIVSVVASAIVGLLAGVLPARRAARLHPVDALRA